LSKSYDYRPFLPKIFLLWYSAADFINFTNGISVNLSLSEMDVFRMEIRNGSMGNNLQSKDGECRESQGLWIDILTVKKSHRPMLIQA
jgi:hypothetical protein